MHGDRSNSPRTGLEGQGTPSTIALVGAFAAIYVVWGSTYLAIRIAIETLPPFLMAAVRFLIAGTLLYAWARRGRSSPQKKHWASALVIGGLMLLGGTGSVVWAEQFVPSGVTALLIATVPLWMVLFDALSPSGMRPSGLTFFGLALGFAGIAVLVDPGGSVSPDGIPWFPAAVLVFASISWAVGSISSRHLPQVPSPLLATAMQMLGGGALLLLLGLATGEAATFTPENVSIRSLLGLIYLIVFGSLIAFSAYVWLLRVSTPARVSTYAYVNPVVAVLLGWYFADEALTMRVAFATLLVVLAVASVVAGRRPSDRSGRRVRAEL